MAILKKPVYSTGFSGEEGDTGVNIIKRGFIFSATALLGEG